MNRRRFLKLGAAGSVMAGLGFSGEVFCEPAAKPVRKPNIVVIIADDLGYGDVGYHGCKEIPTPHIDSIARNGVQFPAGYACAPVCGPSRSGMLTGRYPQRYGFEDNPGPFRQNKDVEVGTPLKEKTIAERLKAIGYKTGMIGKWHEGKDMKFFPTRRGFEEFFGFNNGAIRYNIPNNHEKHLRRGEKILAGEKEYLTDAFGREAAAFVRKHKDEPFFLYLSFNAVHGPLTAPTALKRKFGHIKDIKRRTLAAMNYSMDVNIGKVLSALKQCKLEKETLVFFYSDNGGKPHGNYSMNTPLRGEKGTLYEGGIRVPFCIQWPGKLPAGKTMDCAVSAMDILPTAIAAAGEEVCPTWKLDGVNLLPFMKGTAKGVPHEMLCWRINRQWAIRTTEWKLKNVKNARPEQVQLFHLAKDKSEKVDIAAKRPDMVKQLKAKFDTWAKGTIPPQWGWQPHCCGTYRAEPKR